MLENRQGFHKRIKNTLKDRVFELIAPSENAKVKKIVRKYKSRIKSQDNAPESERDRLKAELTSLTKDTLTHSPHSRNVHRPHQSEITFNENPKLGYEVKTTEPILKDGDYVVLTEHKDELPDGTEFPERFTVDLSPNKKGFPIEGTIFTIGLPTPKRSEGFVLTVGEKSSSGEIQDAITLVNFIAKNQPK